MLKNKGFTLIELLAVIIILSIILLIAVPNVLNLINKSKDDVYEKQKELIIVGAKKYVELYSGKIIWINNGVEISLNQLQEKGLLSETLNNPKGGIFDPVETKIRIKRVDNIYQYNIKDSEDNVGNGDVNGDGEVTKADSELIMEHILGTITLTPEQQERADVNLDGKIGVGDGTLILRYISNLVPWLPYVN
ncbi:MAG: dockerin type I repeat-containing protein [Bacilli bacterium]|jgi:prepilin-type N-terminal cleavage/methylation domain-containing protein